MAYSGSNSLTPAQPDDLVESYGCFGPGTMVMTADGEEPVEWLERGVRVITRDHGFQPIREVIRTTRDPEWFEVNPQWSLLELCEGAVDGIVPSEPVIMARSQRLLVRHPMAELYFDWPEVLVPAEVLADAGMGFAHVPKAPVTLTHLVFDRHEVIQAGGAWAASFLSDAESCKALPPAMMNREQKSGRAMVAARPFVSASEARLLVPPAKASFDALLASA